ncbi:probable G-protein coupled receptor 158 [Pristis pectinata]|uniref:probable G-protein coupled receptor 158 n=1 Tax=Pristis pectinata TaxID=685728 RepID=UPI00223E03DF|nr:probable G-protein coupled receptor 158 [Pristis pectinata]
MSLLSAILYIHLGLLGGFGELQDHGQLSPDLSAVWNVSQISALARSSEGGLDPETSDAATRFLYTGDSAKLLQVNCSRRVEIRGMKGEAAVSLHPVVHGAIDTMVHATNFLNLVFQTNDIRESSVKEDIEWYHALVRSIVEADPKIYRALLTLDVPATPFKSQLVLQATRTQDAIFLQDLSRSHYLENRTSDSEWFHGLKYQKVPHLNKRLLNNDLQTLETPKWSQGDSYMVDKSHVKWSSPFLDCVGEKLIPKWMVTMSTSFYGLKPDLSPEFKGVVRIDINLESLDIDQCSTGDGWFADTHWCDVNTTECSPLKGQGFQLGAYQCVCKEGYYNPNLISTNTNGRQEDEDVSFFSRFAVDKPRTLFQCLPCENGCSSCVSDAPCFTQEDKHLRLAILSFQAFSMLLVFISMLVVYCFRRNKRIRASGLLLLETILGGSILLYFPVFILYFQPSVFRCVILRWVRMLGFAIIYGTITLKIYRVLKVFLSRTAQRVPYMTCCRLLKMLGVIVLTVCWFLVAWTMAAWENMERKIPLVTQSQTADGQRFKMCRLDRWDYMMAAAEFLFLCWGSYLCYTVRTVPSTYHEPRFMGLAIHNEILMSAAFYGLRFTMATTLHPDWMLLLFFVHTHLTVTLTLILLLIPKFLHVGVPLREDIVAEVYEDELDMRCSGSYLNSSITSAWSEHSLDPEDIRDELKKLYAQLEIHKTKKMTANNPHLPKKRSSRRGLGRSIIKRITEIPDSMSRQCSRTERGGSIGTGSYSGSYKKKFNEPSSSSMKVKEDSFKHRVFSIRKSHSTYDHMRGHRDGHTGRTDSSSRDPSLLDSLMRKKLAKKASERSDTESLDAAPLVCKSASAHNLTVDKPSLPSKPGTLQKSLSVVTCAKEKALMLTRRSEENSKQVGERGQKKPSTKHASTSLQLPTVVTQPEEAVKTSNSERQQPPAEGTARLHLQDGRNRSPVYSPDSQNLQPPSSEAKFHKHVTYETIKTGGVDRSHSSGKLDHRKRSMDLERKHHSFRHTGPGSAQGGDVKETTTIRSEPEVTTGKRSGANMSSRVGKSVESLKPESIHPAEHEEVPSKTNKIPSEKMGQVKTGENKREKYISLIKQASTNSAIICPWDVTEEDSLTPTIGVDQKKGRSLSVCTVAPDSLMHGSFKTKATNLSLKQPKGFGLSLKHLVTPGKLKGSRREKSTKAGEKGKGSPDKQKGSITEAVGSMGKSTSTEFCPREGENKSKEEKLQPTDVSKDMSSDISPLEAGHSGSKREKYMTLLKRGSTSSAIICPWDVVLKETAAVSLTEEQKKGRSLSVGAGVSGSLLQGTSNAKGANSPLQQNKRLALSLKHLMSPGKARNKGNKDGKSQAIDKSKIADICPWDTGDTQTKETSVQSDKAEGTQSCPRDAGDMEKHEEKRLSIDKSIISGVGLSTNSAIICPWDLLLKETSAVGVSGEQKKGRSSSVCAGIPGSFLPGTLNAKGANSPLQQNKRLALSLKHLMSPGKARNKDGKSQPIDKVAEICPWDAGDTQSKDTAQPIGTSKAADICPWDTGDTKNKETSLPIDKSKAADICPWDTGDTKNMETSLPIDKSKAADICPWDTGDTKNKEASLPIDKSKAADICPWDTGDTKNKGTSLPVDKSKAADICPWDTGDTKNKEASLPIDKSKAADICPWDTGDTKNMETSLPIDKSKLANVCPWDAGDTERKEEKISPTDESRFADICPWDTVTQETSITSINENQKKGRSQSVFAAIPGSFLQSTLKAKGVNDFLPQSKWSALSLKLRTAKGNAKDSENKGKSLLMNKSKAEDICPWETEDTQSNEEKSQPMDRSNLSDVCPWETDTAATGESQTVAKAKSDVTSTSPCDMEAVTATHVVNKEGGHPIDKENVGGSADSCP